MIRRPPRSTQSRSSAASDVYKRQGQEGEHDPGEEHVAEHDAEQRADQADDEALDEAPVSYTHLRAHETVLDLVCRLLLEKKKPRTTEYVNEIRKDKDIATTFALIVN